VSTSGPRVVAIDHVQLAMPPGPEAEALAVAFYHGLLGLPQVAKPRELAARGGCWFVERMSRPAWNLGDGPEQLSYAATSSFGV
jgi:hypothetical protein